MNKSFSIYAAVLLSFCPLVVEAQYSLASISTSLAAEKKEVIQDETDAIASGLLDSPVVNTRPNVQVSASNNSSTVKLSAGSKWSTEVDQSGLLRSKTLTYTLSTPLNKDADETDLATLDGLTNSTSLAVSLRIIRSRGFRPSSEIAKTCNYQDLMATVRQRCKVKASSDGVLTDEERQQCQTGVVEFGSVGISSTELSASGCSLLDNQQPKTSFFYGGTAKLGYKLFEVFDPSTFDRSTDGKEPYSLNIYTGFVPDSRDKSYLVGFEYQKAKKTATETTRCMPPDTTGFQDCKTGAFSAPVDDDKRLFFLEYRQFLSVSPYFPKGVAIEPRVTFDAESDVFGLDLPIFLFTEKKKGLAAGLRLGWRDDTHDFTVGLFVGAAPFDVFGAD